MKSKEQLGELLKSGKISAPEYELLNSKLSGAKSVQPQWFIVNPFQKISGGQALALGLVIAATMSYLATFAGVYFPSPLSFQVPPTGPLDFSKLLYENLRDIALLAGVAFFVCSAVARRWLRPIDFFGTIALGRIAYAVTTLLWIGVIALFPEIPNMGANSKSVSGAAIAVVLVVAMVALIWQGMLYANALRESSGLRGKPFILAGLFSIVIAELISIGLPKSELLQSIERQKLGAESTAPVGADLSASNGSSIPRDAKRPGFSANLAASANRPASASAEQAALQWVKLIDDKDYGQVWDASSLLFKQKVTRQKWVESIGGARGPFGPLKVRELKDLRYVNALPGVPRGSYYVMTYASEFAQKKEAVETVTMMIDGDGQWHGAGYFIK